MKIKRKICMYEGVICKSNPSLSIFLEKSRISKICPKDKRFRPPPKKNLDMVRILRKAKRSHFWPPVKISIQKSIEKSIETIDRSLLHKRYVISERLQCPSKNNKIFPNKTNISPENYSKNDLFNKIINFTSSSFLISRFLHAY